jgi:predicted heme/steroid binding protein
MKRAQRPPETDFIEGFAQWLESEEGLQSQEAVDCVYNALDGASVDISEKKIIWSDGQRLTIEQSAERIHSEMNLGKDAIINHIIGWLQMEYVPEGLDDEQMEMFESHINAWVKEGDVIRTQSTRF